MERGTPAILHFRKLLSLLFFFFYFSQISDAQQTVRLQLKWYHQFQFAGYYAAIEKGYYKKAGLNVQLLEAKEGKDATNSVLQGQAEFGVGTSDLLLLRTQQKPVVVLAVIFQHSPLILLTRKDPSIQSLHDLQKRPVMIEPGSAELFAYLRRIGGDEFAACLPETSLQGAESTAERLRSETASLKLVSGQGKFQLTISIGAIQVGQEESFNDALQRVDSALYQAKTAGRNQVVIMS